MSMHDGFNCLSDPDASVYPSIEYYDITETLISNEHLHTVVAKFPNLIKIGIYGGLGGDITILKSLSKLSKLLVYFSRGLKWNDLALVLSHIGGNLTELTIKGYCHFIMRQTHMDFLFNHCFNLEYLRIDCDRDYGQQSMVIQPFPKLKSLTYCLHVDRDHDRVILGFDQLLNLEELMVTNRELKIEVMESLCFDRIKYPNLKSICLRFPPLRTHIDRLKKTIRDNNLDLKLYHCHYLSEHSRYLI